MGAIFKAMKRGPGRMRKGLMSLCTHFFSVPWVRCGELEAVALDPMNGEVRFRQGGPGGEAGVNYGEATRLPC